MKNEDRFSFLFNKVISIMIIGTLAFMLAAGAGCSGKKESKEAKAYFTKAEELMKEKKYEEAAKSYHEYSKLQPKEAKGYLKLAKALILAGRPEEAYSVLKKGREMAPDNAELPLTLGNYYMSRKLYEKAKTEYDEAIRLNPENPSPRALKGVVYAEEGNNDEAFRIFKEILKDCDPEKSKENKEAVTTSYRVLLEIIGNELKTDPGAVSIVTRAIKFMPDYGRAYTVLGLIYLKQNKIDSAIKRFEIALAKNPDSEAYVNKYLGKIYEDKGDNKKAVAYYNSFLKAFGPDGSDEITDDAKMPLITIFQVSNEEVFADDMNQIEIDKKEGDFVSKNAFEAYKKYKNLINLKVTREKVKRLKENM